MYTEERVLKAMRNVIDPDLKKDLVTLNMVRNIKFEGKKIIFDLVLTTPACPLKDALRNDSLAALRAEFGDDVEVEINMESKVSTQRKETEAKLKGVKNIIAVASGKGGVGKSTVSANLAIALAKKGAKVGLLDADIYGPSVPLMFGLEGVVPRGKEVDGKTKIIPVEKYGVKMLSIGFFVEQKQALLWRGSMATNAMNQLLNDADWGELDYFVIDLPPGTGDIHLTMVQAVPVTGVVIVTTPQEVALADARKAFSMFKNKDISVPVLGVVENMSWFTPAELPENKYYIFGKGGGERIAKEFGHVLLGQIPLVQSIQESGNKGEPVALHEDTPEGKAFLQLAENMAQQVAIRNANLQPTKVVQVDTSGASACSV